jgi:hypothetical protein
MLFSERSGGSLRGAAARVKRVVRVTPPPVRRPPSAVSPSTPGSRKAAMFFDKHPRFYETSRTIPSVGRLNLRYEAIFGENRDIFAGARVLDIASHDGRWSLAALACGARSVIGVEARAELVGHAAENLERYGYGPQRATFVAGDVHEVLAELDTEVDVVLCLGFLYHTLRYNELLHGIRRTSARHVVIDTQAQRMMHPKPSVQLLQERVEVERNAAADRFCVGDRVLSGRPNLAAIRTMMDAYGYRIERLSDWAGLLRDNPGLKGCGDYARGSRITVRCVAKDATVTP